MLISFIRLNCFEGHPARRAACCRAGAKARSREIRRLDRLRCRTEHASAFRKERTTSCRALSRGAATLPHYSRQIVCSTRESDMQRRKRDQRDGGGMSAVGTCFLVAASETLQLHPQSLFATYERQHVQIEQLVTRSLPRFLPSTPSHGR